MGAGKYYMYIKVVWKQAKSNVKQLTQVTVSLPHAWVWILLKAFAKVASDLDLGGGFVQVFQFPLLITIIWSFFNLNMKEKVILSWEN